MAGGGNSQPVSQDVPQKNRRGDGDDHFEHVVSFDEGSGVGEIAMNETASSGLDVP